MEFLPFTIVGLLLILGAFGGALFLAKHRVGKASGAATAEVLGKVEIVTGKLKSLLPYTKSYTSKKLLEQIASKIEEVQVNLATEHQKLGELEKKLEIAQKDVETREAAHQEIKSAKAEDEEKLTKIMEEYEQISSDSIALEQRLASSLKNVDQMMVEVKMTEEQKAVLSGLSEALTNAGGQLRDLITEYKMIQDRLKALTQQAEDLEEEYTRLVEQQLGS